MWTILQGCAVANTTFIDNKYFKDVFYGMRNFLNRYTGKIASILSVHRLFDHVNIKECDYQRMSVPESENTVHHRELINNDLEVLY